MWSAGLAADDDFEEDVAPSIAFGTTIDRIFAWATAIPDDGDEAVSDFWSKTPGGAEEDDSELAVDIGEAQVAIPTTPWQVDYSFQEHLLKSAANKDVYSRPIEQPAEARMKQNKRTEQ